MGNNAQVTFELEAVEKIIDKLRTHTSVTNIHQKTGIPQNTLYRLFRGETQIGDVRFETISKLLMFYQQITKTMSIEDVGSKEYDNIMFENIRKANQALALSTALDNPHIKITALIKDELSKVFETYPYLKYSGTVLHSFISAILSKGYDDVDDINQLVKEDLEIVILNLLKLVGSMNNVESSLVNQLEAYIRSVVMLMYRIKKDNLTINELLSVLAQRELYEQYVDTYTLTYGEYSYFTQFSVASNVYYEQLIEIFKNLYKYFKDNPQSILKEFTFLDNYEQNYNKLFQDPTNKVGFDVKLIATKIVDEHEKKTTYFVKRVVSTNQNEKTIVVGDKTFISITVEHPFYLDDFTVNEIEYFVTALTNSLYAFSHKEIYNKSMRFTNRFYMLQDIVFDGFNPIYHQGTQPILLTYRNEQLSIEHVELYRFIVKAQKEEHFDTKRSLRFDEPKTFSNNINIEEQDIAYDIANEIQNLIEIKNGNEILIDCNNLSFIFERLSHSFSKNRLFYLPLNEDSLYDSLYMRTLSLRIDVKMHSQGIQHYTKIYLTFSLDNQDICRFSVLEIYDVQSDFFKFRIDSCQIVTALGVSLQTALSNMLNDNDNKEINEMFGMIHVTPVDVRGL